MLFEMRVTWLALTAHWNVQGDSWAKYGDRKVRADVSHMAPHWNVPRLQ